MQIQYYWYKCLLGSLTAEEIRNSLLTKYSHTITMKPFQNTSTWFIQCFLIYTTQHSSLYYSMKYTVCSYFKEQTGYIICMLDLTLLSILQLTKHFRILYNNPISIKWLSPGLGVRSIRRSTPTTLWLTNHGTLGLLNRVFLSWFDLGWSTQ